MNTNCLSYWFPLIQSAGLPVPETIILRIPESALDWACGDSQEAPRELIVQVADAAQRVGYPAFIRTGQTSEKHSWKDSCFLASPEQIASHVRELGEFSMMCDMFGLPFDVLAVRRMLPTSPAFIAFNGMPIVREFRFFVRDGIVEHIQPYWPPNAIDGNTEHEGWREVLDSMNIITEAERETLSALSVKANSAVPGFWSIDWLETKDGWFLTDMAEGDRSFRWEP